jgi:uncharacterized protein (TIGR00369 family)
MDLPAPYRAPTGFDALYGLEISSADSETVRGSVRVSDEVKQPAGVVHGGVYASIAESLASFGTLAGVLSEGKSAMGLGNSTSFLRPISAGTIHGEARVLHRGRTTWVWDVRLEDDEGRLCAVTRMTIAVRGGA